MTNFSFRESQRVPPCNRIVLSPTRNAHSGLLGVLGANLDALVLKLNALGANLDELGANLDALGANLVALGVNVDALGANLDLQKPSKV